MMNDNVHTYLICILAISVIIITIINIKFVISHYQDLLISSRNCLTLAQDSTVRLKSIAVNLIGN